MSAVFLDSAMSSINAKNKKMKKEVYSNVTSLRGCLLISKKGGVL